MAITTTGSFIQGSGPTVDFTVANVGDLLVVSVTSVPASVTITGCSGNNSLGVMSSTANVSDSPINVSQRLFWATAGATGTVTITPTYSGTSTQVQFDGWMFTAGLGAGTVWTTDASNTNIPTGSTTMNYPTLTASGSGELYVGCACPGGTGAAGSTSGYSYNVDSVFTCVFCYNLNVSGSQSPTATETNTGDKTAVGAIISASTGGGSAPAPVAVQAAGQWACF